MLLSSKLTLVNKSSSDDLINSLLCMQFTCAGHTKLHGNAMMITSTITVVLFSTVVSYCHILKHQKEKKPTVQFYFQVTKAIELICLIHAGVWVDD